MSRHRGRSRPFTARRPIFPRHCACLGCGYGFPGAPRLSLFDAHVVRTVAPR